MYDLEAPESAAKTRWWNEVLVKPKLCDVMSRSPEVELNWPDQALRFSTGA